MDLYTLKAELDTDPLGRGYSGMTNLQAADSLAVADRTLSRETLDAWEAFQAVDETEWGGLSNAEKAQIKELFGMGAIKARQPSRAVDWIVAAFGGGSQTVTNLKALRDTTVNRGVELGLGNVREGEVAMARGL